MERQDQPASAGVAFGLRMSWFCWFLLSGGAAALAFALYRPSENPMIVIWHVVAIVVATATLVVLFAQWPKRIGKPGVLLASFLIALCVPFHPPGIVFLCNLPWDQPHSGFMEPHPQLGILGLFPVWGLIFLLLLPLTFAADSER